MSLQSQPSAHGQRASSRAPLGRPNGAAWQGSLEGTRSLQGHTSTYDASVKRAGVQRGQRSEPGLWPVDGASQEDHGRELRELGGDGARQEGAPHVPVRTPHSSPSPREKPQPAALTDGPSCTATGPWAWQSPPPPVWCVRTTQGPAEAQLRGSARPQSAGHREGCVLGAREDAHTAADGSAPGLRGGRGSAHTTETVPEP